MKGRQIILGHFNGHEVAALLVDGVLEDLLVDSDSARPGAIYRAKAVRAVKGQGGMFFDTPDGRAFLRGGKGLSVGETHLVQVSGYADPGKAIPVTSRLLFKGRLAIVTPNAPGMNISRNIKDEEDRLNIRAAAETELAETTAHGLILRSVCATADAADISEDVDEMLSLADAILADTGTDLEKLLEGPGPHDLALRDWEGTDIVEGDVDDLIVQACSVDIRLAGGASMSVEPTRALVAVDVNTGSDTSPAAGLKANIAAVKALPRALRVKGLGGQIVIDLAPMPKKDRKALEAALKAALRADDVDTSIVGWTPLGHLELTRKRARNSILSL